MLCCGQVVAGPDLDPVEKGLAVIVVPDYGFSAPFDHFVFQSGGIGRVGKGTDLDIEFPGVEIPMGQEAMVFCIVVLIGDGLAQSADPDPGCAFLDNVQLPGRRQAQIDNPSLDKGAAVVDPDHHFPAVLKIFDQHHGLQGQGFVGRGFGVHIVAFAAGGFTAVEFTAVPGSNTGFDKALCRGQWVIDPAVDPVRPLG